MKNEQKPNSWLAIIIILSIVLWSSLVIIANGWRVDNIKKNKENCELRGYKQAWLDFNKSFIPSTALPRIKEIEDVYNEGKK